MSALEVSGLPPLLSRRHAADGFVAEVVTGELGPLRVAEIVTPAGECFRDERSAREVDSGFWQVDLVARGHARIEQGGGTAELGPGDFVLVDPVRPVRIASTDTTSVTLMVPRRSLRLRPREVDRLVGARVRGDRGPAALVASVVRDMTGALTGFRAADAARTATAVTELIAVALAGREERPAPDAALRARIEGFIEARLGDRSLSPAMVAAAHHVSVRRLHKLFEDEPDTVAALIRRRRLERCHAELAAGGRTVVAVSARWGFADPAHFSRLFKANYGYNATALTSSTRARTVKAPTARSGQDGS